MAVDRALALGQAWDAREVVYMLHALAKGLSVTLIYVLGVYHEMKLMLIAFLFRNIIVFVSCMHDGLLAFRVQRCWSRDEREA